MSAIDSFLPIASARYVRCSSHAGCPPVALQTAAAFVRLYRVRLATLIRRSLFCTACMSRFTTSHIWASVGGLADISKWRGTKPSDAMIIRCEIEASEAAQFEPGAEAHFAMDRS